MMNHIADNATAGTDADIRNAVLNALGVALGVLGETITPRVHDRWVWLLGAVETPEQRTAAQHAAEAVPGINGVTNMLRIEPSAAASISTKRPAR